MRTLLTRLRKNPEEGSLAAYFVLLVVVLMGVVGLVVDSAGKYTAAEEAQAVASAATRAAINAISSDTLQSGSLSVDSSRAETAAEAYIAASGMTGTAVVNNDVVTVTVTTTYATKFISLLGVNTLAAGAKASAQLITN